MSFQIKYVFSAWEPFCTHYIIHKHITHYTFHTYIHIHNINTRAHTYIHNHSHIYVLFTPNKTNSTELLPTQYTNYNIQSNWSYIRSSCWNTPKPIWTAFILFHIHPHANRKENRQLWFFRIAMESSVQKSYSIRKRYNV